MKSICLSALALVCASSASAGIVAEPNPINDSTGAVVLLALTVMVIALGVYGPSATQNKNSLDIEEEEADDKAGF